MQRLDYPPLHQGALPTQNHQRNKKWSQFPLPQRKTTETCDNHRCFSKHLFDGDNSYFTVFLTFLGHQGSHSVTLLCIAKPR